MLLFLASLAFAADPPAFYHPDDVARASQQFASLSANMTPQFEAREGEVSRASGGLARMEIAVGLLGAEAPTTLTRWYEDARRDLTGQSLAVQRHADRTAEASSAAFGAALERALPIAGAGYSVRDCGASGVAAMMGRTTCGGENLNAKLAAAIDADATLAKAIAPLAKETWPAIALPDTPLSAAPLQAGRATSTRWIDGARIAEALVGGRLDAARERAAREADAARENGDTKAVKASRDAWMEQLATDGIVLREVTAHALDRAAKREPKLATVGWCTNPRVFGGCAGEDVTMVALEALQKDKKLAKALKKRLPDESTR